jgi:diguanylate cyclase (GGDEF)-like protein
MKNLLPTFAILFACTAIAWAAKPFPLTTLRAVTALSNAEASQGLPVAFEGTVTYFDRSLKILYMQEGDKAVYVKATTNSMLIPGDRILVQGATQASFLPYVRSNNITVLGHGALPTPMPATFDELVRKDLNCRLVSVHGVVRTADVLSSQTSRIGHLQLLMDGGYIDIDVNSDDTGALKDMLDAEVQVTGTSAGTYDGKMQQTGVKLKVSTLADISIHKHASSNPWSLPVIPMGEIITGYHVHDLSQRLRVHGTITYYQPGLAIVLQSGATSLWVSTQTSEPMQVGDVADAIGIPDTRDGSLTLAHAEIEDDHLWAPITPQSATWHQLASRGRNGPAGHQYDLVSIEGQVATEVRESTQDEYVLVSDSQVFSAIYHHPAIDNEHPQTPMKQVPLGSRVIVSGICILGESRRFDREMSFDILMRTPEDIAVVARPSLLSIRNLIILVSLLLAVVIVVGARGWAIERRVRRQTAALAALERRRGRILEDINGARPLAEILEEITKLVSFQLKDAPCWCQITDGARLGNCPPQLTNLRIVNEKIPARSGTPLGAIFAAFDSHTKPSAFESEALSMTAGLATLAIETRRLYSDLLHRSEFDMLTDIHNRFSLEKQLDAQIDEARLQATVFGLIYIDLDNFKQVNDSYGHQAGDQYLHEVALRLKKQLRPHDKLARLGGDEFAALVPVVRSRTEANEIAQRLERCFGEPFTLEGLTLTGSASFGIALYPEDGTTRDDLLNAADAAMYIVKNAKRQIEKDLSQSSQNS